MINYTGSINITGNLYINNALYTDIVPIGTILMYDGASWIDNSTIIGWYKCDGTNGTPNLIDKFIKGNSTSGSSGGSNTKTISANNLPTHTHTIDHTHTASSVSTDPGHTHPFKGQDANSVEGTGGFMYWGQTMSATTVGGAAGDHAHTATINTYSGSSGNNTTTATDLDVQPAFYTVIFIKKVS